MNNAGFAVVGFAEDIQLEELRLQFETDFFGAVAMTKAVLPTMPQQRSGRIIQVSSIVGLHGSVTVSSYSASKRAREGWRESLGMELNALGIKVVLVEPGAFQRSLRVRERIGKLPKAGPITVAKKIVEIAQNPNPNLRYVVGRDAKVQLAMKRVLLRKWQEKVIANLL